MSTRNLEFVFKPRSVALVGASQKRASVGAVLTQNLLQAGFGGRIMVVHPKHRKIAGMPVYPDIASLSVAPDLAVISTPPATVPAIIAELGARGTKAAVVLTTGFGESTQAGGQELQQALLAAAKPHLLRVVGPNCLGVMVPGAKLNASFAHISPRPGHLAFVAQSGAIVTSVLDWAEARGIGFSHLISLGDMADVDLGDLLDFLANDSGTRAILLYVEAVCNARKFLSAARAAARVKPVVVVKAGRTAEAARAAATHSGAPAGRDAVYDAAFRRAGILRVCNLTELFDAVEILAMTHPARGDRLAILTNGGGIGVLAADALIDQGGRLAELAPDTLAALGKVLPPTWSQGNPVDIVDDAPGSRYTDALRLLLRDQGVDAVLALNCPTAIASGTEAARAVVQALAEEPKRTIVTNWLGKQAAKKARNLFKKHRIPTYNTPEQAVRGLMYTVNYRRSQDALMETPPSVSEDFVPDTTRARRPIEQAIKEGRDWLTEPEAKQVLAAYGIPVVATLAASNPQEAAAQAAQIGGAVVLKILSPDITHKTDVSGVALDLTGPVAVRDAAVAMLQRVSGQRPEARIAGFSVQPMVQRPRAYELIIGMIEDPQFGPVILFGQGGTAVDVIDDKALGLPALNMRLAHELMSRTRVYRLLQGYRGLPAANLDAIALSLIKIAQLAVDVPEVCELDINPLLTDEFGVLALDARMRVARASHGATERLAIRPYPKELEETIPLGDGRTLLFRPIVPEDEGALRAGFARLTPEEVRLRFFIPMKTLSHLMAARFTQLDYDREMALILTEPGVPGTRDIFGVVRISADPDNERAEYAIIIQRSMTGMGLGIFMMRRIIEYARSRGIGELFGDVLRDNTTMLRLCQALGFSQQNLGDEPDIVRVILKL